MALDTLGDLKTYVQRTRRDYNIDTLAVTYEHWTEAQTEDDLNLAIQAFCDEVPLATVFGTWEQAPDAENTGEYVPPAGYDLDEVIYLKTGTSRLTPTTVAELSALDLDWDTRTGTPVYYIPHFRIDGGERHIVRVVPLPSTALTDLKGEFTRVHPWLTEDTERPLIPIQYRMAIAAYALHLGYAADKQETQDMEKAAYWLGRYQDAVKRAKRKAARRFDRSPSTVTLQR